jgi:2-haloalkanoic acid dehalogenase type II
LKIEDVSGKCTGLQNQDIQNGNQKQQKVNMVAIKPLASYKALSFDIYGTLIDWEAGIAPSLNSLTSRLPDSHPCKTSQDALIAAFNKHEVSIIQEDPKILYDEALKQTYYRLANEWNLDVDEKDANATADSIKHWKAFPDTIAAMQALGRKYKLIALSNITASALNVTIEKALPGVKFDALLTAQEIGSYKPDHRNFRYLLNVLQKDFGIEKDELLHVAHGVKSDQVPAEELGIAHAWIRRGKDNWNGVEKMQDLKTFETLGDLANEADS